MNFSGFDFDDKTKKSLEAVDVQNRMPHAILIESTDKKKSLRLAEFISMWAVCRGSTKPCKTCSQCIRAEKHEHADIYYAYPEKKSGTYTIEQMRNIIKDAYILPNEANAKVYIFKDADIRLSAIVQNAFLKLLEEPPKNVLFILLCEQSNKMLATILSRCTVFKIKSDFDFDADSLDYAKKIVDGILSSREYDLLKALNCLKDKEKCIQILQIVKLILRDALVALYCGNAQTDEQRGKKLAVRFTKGKIIEMIELTETAVKNIQLNININLLTTWLCGEYRRISWQR